MLRLNLFWELSFDCKTLIPLFPLLDTTLSCPSLSTVTLGPKGWSREDMTPGRRKRMSTTKTLVPGRELSTCNPGSDSGPEDRF